MNPLTATLAGSIVATPAASILAAGGSANVVTLAGAADLTNVLFIGAAVFGALLLGGAGYLVVRRVRAWSQQDEPTESFTLQDLRELQRAGQISPREYEALRKTIIAGVAADASGSDAAREAPPADAADANPSADSDGSDGGESGGDEPADNEPDGQR